MTYNLKSNVRVGAIVMKEGDINNIIMTVIRVDQQQKIAVCEWWVWFPREPGIDPDAQNGFRRAFRFDDLLGIPE